MNLSQLRSYVTFATKFLGRLALAAVYLLAGAVMAWLVLRLSPGDRWTPVRLGNYFAPWLFMALLPGLLIALAGRRRRLVRVIVVLIVIFAGLYGPVLVPRQPQVYADPGPKRLRVMTYNVNFKNRNAQEIADMIRRESPDIIAFQEMTQELLELLRPQLEEIHPYYLVDNSWGLNMILVSRYPLTVLPKPAQAARAQHALVETPNGPVVIWNVHPNPAISNGWESQRALLALVADDVARERRPVMVLGDFNTTELTENYGLIANHLTDVHQEVGRGFGFTFPSSSRQVRDAVSLPRLVRIDHIFYSDHFYTLEARTLPESGGSDHLPVVAELVRAR